jgi:N utilization substance protein B
VSELGAQRHHARERALEILYEATIKDRSLAVVLNELNIRPDAYTVALLVSADEHREQANELISQFSIDWPIERMAMVDRLVMTLAIAEMLLKDAPPKAVILDEAVELAKVYSTDNSPSFVNGVLSSVAENILN